MNTREQRDRKRMEIYQARQEMQAIIATAELQGVTLSRLDFGYDDGTLTLDGMPASEWAEAVLEDDD